MFDKAVALIEREGLHKALYEFNTNRSEFVDNAIHVMVVSDGGDIFAHSYNPESIGVSLAEQKSADVRDQYTFQNALADMNKVGNNNDTTDNTDQDSKPFSQKDFPNTLIIMMSIAPR